MATISVATPCLAASEINVQFGSYETRDEAEKRVSDITSAHKNDLGGKAPAIREVKLPPDNLTVFRTQAGPYDSRATAQSICQKLSSTGDECYVVESAVASPVAPTPVAPAPVAAAAPPPPAPAAPAPVVTAPAPPPPAPIQLAPLSAANAAPSSNVNALPPATLPPVAAANASPFAPSLAPAPSPQMQAAFDQAATAQTTGSLPPAPPPATVAPAPQPSFWSRMFGSDTATPAPQPSLPPLPPAPIVVAAAPTPEVASANVAPLPVPPANSSHAWSPAPVALPSAPPPPPPVLPAVAEKPLAPPPGAVAATHFTPPLAPFPPPPQPQDSRAFAPPPPPPALPQPAPAPTANVHVEEAKRVPLSQIPAPAVSQVPAVSLLPSATLGQRTLWAELGQFHDMQAALNYWAHYRETHPDFPVIRVRVISSLSDQYHGNDRVSLRVGPFTHTGFIRHLCESIDQSQQQEEQAREDNPSLPAQPHVSRCNYVKDLGFATNIGTLPGYLNGSRYKRN